MIIYEKPSIEVIELLPSDGYLADINKASIFDDPQIDDDPTDSFN